MLRGFLTSAHNSVSFRIENTRLTLIGIMTIGKTSFSVNYDIQDSKRKFSITCPKLILATAAIILTFSLIWIFIADTKIEDISKCSIKMGEDFVYPIARRDDTIYNDFHGTKVINK